MFTENFFTKLLNLEDGWIVESIETDLSKAEIYIHIVCLLDEIIDVDSDEFCKVYDFAPERSWRHLDTMQYKTFIRSRLPRIKTSNGKIKTVQPNWASGYERHTFFVRTRCHRPFESQ